MQHISIHNQTKYMKVLPELWENYVGNQYFYPYGVKEPALIGKFDYTHDEQEILEKLWKAKESLAYVENTIWGVVNKNKFGEIRKLRTACRKTSLMTMQIRDWLMRRMEKVYEDRDKLYGMTARDDYERMKDVPKKRNTFDYQKALRDRRKKASEHLRKKRKK